MKEKWTLVKDTYSPFYLELARGGYQQRCPWTTDADLIRNCGTWCPAFQISHAPDRPEQRFVLLNCMPRAQCIELEKEES